MSYFNRVEWEKKTPSPYKGEGMDKGVHPRNLKLVGRAQSLRKNITEVEKILWYYLRSRRFEGIKFRRQYPIGKYVVDFIVPECGLVIELDGGQHALQQKKDMVRDAYLKSQGYHVLKFWNHEVTGQLDSVLQRVYEIIYSRKTESASYPNPLPSRERRSYAQLEVA